MELIGPELARRFWAPCKSVTFYSYLLFGVILCGGSGVLLTILKSRWGVEDISAALLGYFPALVGAAVLELTAEYQPYVRSLGVIALSTLLPVVLIAASSEHGWKLFWSLTGTVLSILLWWVANGPNVRFNDVKPESALGGDESGSLPESQAEGWKK
jgi:hypothetical protein